ncbi:hypothetical protein ABPG74_019612 [Tetrahymena malaccensis]
MKYLILRLILTVSVPIIIGVGLVLSIFYQLLWKALDQWELDSANWVYQTQKQVLYNSVYSQQILLEYSFNQLEIQMVVMKGLLNKYQSSQMTYNPETIYTFCSFREYMFNECPQNVYDQINESIFYAQLYFVRSIFKYDLLPPEQQYFIKMNSDLSFYSGAAFLAAQKSGIIQISSIHNADKTTAYTDSPSVLYNYTQSTYYTCKGTNYSEPYDPRCRQWYQYAQQNKGMFIYQPYNDALTGALQMSLSTQILKDFQFYSVHTIIFKMQNLVRIFDSYLSLNSYTVLFHEFNATVFYHPLLIFYQTMQWEDVEFFNINQFCNISNIDICKSQKQQFKTKVNQTIQFIKTGNYNIENQTNIDYLYQTWERFGQKQISVVFPIQSKFKGVNNQQPYSFAILLLARVITDNSDQMKLFNLLNTNIIRVYLLIGFSLLSAAILIFITNYGLFLVLQIQNPIELLTIFLNKSYLEQLTYQTKGNQNKVEKYIQLQIQNQVKQIQKRYSVSKRNSKNQNLFQKLWKDPNKIKKMNNKIQQQHQLQNSSIIQSQNLTKSNQQSKQLQFSFNQQKENQFDNYEISEILPIKNNSSSPKQQNSPLSTEKINNCIFQSNFIENQSNIQDHCFIENKNNFQSNTSTFKTITEKSNKSILNEELIHSKIEDKNQILKGLKPLFLEMKIIKQVFQDLESLINYSIDAQKHNSEDYTNSLFHFSQAKSTFQQLKNQTGLGRCYYNLGLVSLLNQNYSTSLEYLESSIQLSFEQVGIDYNNLMSYKILNKSQNSNEKQILLVIKRVFSKAHCTKQLALQYYYNNLKEIFGNNSLQKNQAIPNHTKKFCNQSDFLQQLSLSLEMFQVILRFVENNQSCFSEVFKIFLYQEVIEVYIFLRQTNNQQIQKLIDKVKMRLDNLKNQDYIMEDSRQAECHEKKKQRITSIHSNFNISEQIIEIQKSRILFLLALIQQNNNNISEAINLFIQSIEEGSFYSPSLRKKAIYHLCQLDGCISDMQLKNLISKDEGNLLNDQNHPLDLIILLELEYYQFHSTVERCIQRLQKLNFFNNSDRIQILIYHSEIHTFMPFTIIQNNQHLNLIIDSLKEIQRTIFDAEINKQLNWWEALIESLNYIYYLKQSDLVSLKNAFIQNKQLNIQNEEIQRILQIQNQKVILIFSKDQEYDNYIQNNNINIKLQFFKYQKPIVYHLKEYSILLDNTSVFDSSLMKYESFYDENKFISKLIQQRNQENLNDEQEFISILFNS